MPSREFITITMTAAVNIIQQALELFRDGAGYPLDEASVPIEGDSINEEFPGIIDEFNPDSPEYEWANALLQFVRLVHAILNNAVEEAELTDEESV